MPTKIKEGGKETDIESLRPKEKRRHHKSTRSTQKPKKTCSPQNAGTTSSSPTAKRRASLPETKSDRPSSVESLKGSKASLPYPTFSKAHSKEALGSSDNVRLTYYTPDPTDIEKGTKRNEAEERRKSIPVAPPSPPETLMEDKVRSEVKKEPVKVERKTEERKKTDLQKAADELKKRLTIKSGSTSELRSELRSRRSELTRSKDNPKEAAKETTGKSAPVSARSSKPSTPSRSRVRSAMVEGATSTSSLRKSSSSALTARSEPLTESTDSDATSIAPEQPSMQRPLTTQADREPSTPTPDHERQMPKSLPQPRPSREETPAFSTHSCSRLGSYEQSPMPPPPPPVPDVSPPRVDYLLKNGGLPSEVPRSISHVRQTKPAEAQANGTQSGVATLFSPYANVLDDYLNVMDRNGSIAVATGYRSIARRLLDRLEAVFARDISSETCDCVICQTSQGSAVEKEEGGVSWGEILEYVSDRQVLPQWPPFFFDNVGLGIAETENAAPMQKLDTDVPEEFKAHYIRQSKKTKEAVDSWLEKQPSNTTAFPQDFDDETLTFAMLTRLEPEQRSIFKSLLGVPPSRPGSATESAVSLSPDSDLLPKTGLAIQRLYRLSSPPRDPDSAMFLLSNPHLHGVLATLAAISDHEWEILTSGRFDGFLRSGAEDLASNIQKTPSPSNRPSSNPTTLSRSISNPSPAHANTPITLDEETEIAALAEVEREIFLCLDSLEDAFELLHQKAECVRSALRERGAGLAQASQRRRCGSVSALDARMGTPASINDGWGGSTVGGGPDGWDEWEAESIAPDDSASNVSKSRMRRPKRRNERRTPALVEEEDEGDARGGPVEGREKEKEKGGGNGLGSWIGRRRG